MNHLINSVLFSPFVFIVFYYWGIAPQYDYSHNNIVERNYFNSDSTYIKWIGQIPSIDKQRGKQKFTNKLLNIVIGKKTTVLAKPIDVLVKSGSLVMLDQGNQTLLTFNKDQSEITPFFKNDVNYFPSLVEICSFDSNHFLFSDSKLNKIFIVDSNTKKIQVLNDSLQLQQPTGVAYSSISHEIWIVETHAHRICVLDEKGNFIKTIGSRGSEPGKFNYPTSIWIDQFGTIYIIDSLNYRVQIFNKEGELLSVFGKLGDASGYFARPKGIATDSYGNIYIVDALFHAVQVFDKSGNFLYQFGSQGREKEQFWLPAGIYIDEKDYIYVADSYNSRIQIFQLIREI